MRDAISPVMARLRDAAAAALVACGLAACGGGGGSGNNSAPPSTNYFDSVVYASGPLVSLPAASELAASSKHTIAIEGSTYAYTATAGHLTAQDIKSGAPEASFFYVAYTLDGADPATRPVTFFYNGGPGSATAWLHLGSFGPKRLTTGNPSTATPPPFPLVDNPHSLLDVTDLVFVDAVGAGFSEAIAPNTDRTFWGVDVDAAVFRDFVMRYVAVNKRDGSPKYLFGESYGTTRSAVLANVLEMAGVAIDGVILQSSILNYNVNCGELSGANCFTYLPSYAATGAWYGRTQPDPAPSALPPFIDSVRTLASTRYAPAVAQFASTGTAPPADLLAQLVAATGVPLPTWQTRFNLDPGHFQTALLPGTLLGVYDTRVSAPIGSPLAADGDPSSTFYDSGFASAVPTYLASLGYTTPSTYVLLGNAISYWKFGHGSLSLPDVVPDLAAAMLQDPQLRVLSLNGYHDIATPFFGTQQDLARLDAGDRVATRFYVGGHMTYLDDDSQAAEKADLKGFYQAGSTP
jgi:carboxypeptidase C (cathepsin A)